MTSLARPGPAASAPAEPQVTPASVLAYVRASDLHVSPDGSKLAYVATSYGWDAKPHVRILEIATGVERELTPAGKSERSPQWSPDGRRLGFLSNRDGKTQVYSVPAEGGSPTPLTARKNGVDAFHWSPDGQGLAYLAKDDAAPSENAGPQVADNPDALSRLWIADLASASARAVGPRGWRIDEFQWLDKARLLVVARDHPRADAFNAAVYSLALSGGGFTPAATPPQPFEGLLVSPDGQRLAVRGSARHGPLERDLLAGPVTGGALTPVSIPPDLAVAEVRWRQPGAIWARVVDGFTNRIVRLVPGRPPIPVDLGLSAAAFDVLPDGGLVFVGEDYDHPPQIYLRTPEGRRRQLSHLQSGAALAPPTATEVFRTASFDGAPIEAALMKPAQAPSAGTKAPLVLLVHGGPSSNFTAGFGWEAAWARLLVAHGYQVLMVNPRGSNGYSEAFLEANRGDWGGGDYRDLTAVLDAVIARGEVDPQRLGVGGWSYGGEMTAWAITQTRRFKAAVAGAPVFDQQAEFESEAHPEGDEWYFGSPWEHPDVFARNSPASFIRYARTPTLILDGEDDVSNPVGQSKGLYRALKHFGVETEMVLYPGEGHSPRTGSYNVDMFQRILDWYDRWLGAPR